MSAHSLVLPIAFAVLAICAPAAEPPQNSPFAPAGAPAAAATKDNLEFAGVTTLGKTTRVNLLDKQSKISFWVEVGQTANGVTVVNYDSEHDQVTVKTGDGASRVLPLRSGAVVAGPAGGATPMPMGNVSTAALAAQAATPTTSLSQARQEEEARMLVSDLLEIGMAQRKAYEEAQRRAAAGQSTPPAQAATGSSAGNATQSAPPPAGQ